MTVSDNPPSLDHFVLKLFCTEQEEALRVYVDAAWMPPFLRACFDKDGEAFPVLLDFEDLDRFMRKRGSEYQKNVAKLGDVELTARGRAAMDLAQWLAAAFASSFREDAVAPKAKANR